MTGLRVRQGGPPSGSSATSDCLLLSLYHAPSERRTGVPAPERCAAHARHGPGRRYSSHMAAPRDTSRDAFAIQIEKLRAAGPEARVAMAAEMSDAVFELAVAGIRRRNPEFDDTRIGQVLIEHLYGARAGAGRPRR